MVSGISQCSPEFVSVAYAVPLAMLRDRGGKPSVVNTTQAPRDDQWAGIVTARKLSAREIEELKAEFERLARGPRRRGSIVAVLPSAKVIPFMSVDDCLPASAIESQHDARA